MQPTLINLFFLKKGGEIEAHKYKSYLRPGK